MTKPIPVAEVIAERRYGGLPTVRVICPGCSRTHVHRSPTDAATPLVGACGTIYTLGGGHRD